MQLRNQVEWTLHCCVIMGALKAEERLSTKDLAEFHGVPKEYLSKALQSLAQSGLIEGTLGPTGGYCLAKPAHKISILDIVESIEGKKRTFKCEEIRGNNPCIQTKSERPSGVCTIAKAMYKADEAWRKELRSVTLADLNKDVAKEVGRELLERSQEWLLGR